MNATELVKKKSIVLAVILLFMFCWLGTAAAEEGTGAADKWQYELTIYGWLPTIDGSLNYSLPPSDGNPGTSVSADAGDILDALNFTFMAAGVARYNKLSFGMDLIYMDLSNSSGTEIIIGNDPGEPVDIKGKLSLTAWEVTGVVGYDAIQTKRVLMTPIAGFRYLTLDADLNIAIDGPLPPTPPPAKLSDSADLWDGIVGVRGAFLLNEKWYIPYYADIGAGDSALTWQLYAGIGYMFHWGDIKLGYRYLEYDMDEDELLQDLKFYGPLLGVGFRF